MPSISAFGYSIIIRNQQYLAPWMHTLSLHTTHPKTRRNNTILSQTKHGQTSPAQTPTFMGILSLPLYRDIRLVIELGQENWDALARSKSMFSNSLPRFDIPTYSIHVDWGIHTIIPNAITISHVPHGILGIFHEQKVHHQTLPNFFKLPFPKGRLFLTAGNDHSLASLSSSSWFFSSLSLILLCRDMTPWWSSSILGPLKNVGLSYLQAGHLPPFLISAVTKVTEKCQDMTPRCHESDNLFSEIERMLRHSIPAYLSSLSTFDQAIYLSPPEEHLRCQTQKEHWGESYLGKCYGLHLFSQDNGKDHDILHWYDDFHGQLLKFVHQHEYNHHCNLLQQQAPADSLPDPSQFCCYLQ